MIVSFKISLKSLLLMIALLAGGFVSGQHADAQTQAIPDALKPWEEWATWNDRDRNSPSVFNNADDRISFWPSRLNLVTGPETGKWEVTVKVFAESWIPLPGNNQAWPQNVFVNGEPIPVVERDGRPVVQLPSGRYELSGEFQWITMPQRIAIPREIGLLTLVVDEKAVDQPNWDADGFVWLKRKRTEPAEANSITALVYRVIDDGIPTWLRTDIVLTVSGKSREEELGWILPEGWKLANISSPIPVAVDDLGRTKAQVRAGKWTISVNAFRATDTREIKFAEAAQPITNLELVGFKSNPTFRLAEITGLQPVDVSQTTFPEKWHGLPVFQWDTTTAIQIEEKMRGMGLQRPDGLSINRQFWLDEDGQGMTYRDDVNGQMQQIWRLDTAAGQEIGSVRVNGTSQLITSNPTTGAHGVEIRSRNLQLELIGRIDQANAIPATGWQSDADSLTAIFNLPPGWRVFALFGADTVQGDWLTAWSLLDLFLLLIFSAAVFRMWGFWAGIIAFLAFGLAYHEPGAPRITWLFLLMPVGLLRVVHEGTAHKWIKFWKFLAIGLLIINLAPFLGSQIQNAIYPQLERPGVNYAQRGMFWFVNRAYVASAKVADLAYEDEMSVQSVDIAGGITRQQKSKFDSSNLLYDPKARIQTGPAQPEWNWNEVRCQWDGPVSQDQSIQPILISRNQNRIITVVRILLLTWLTAILIIDGIIHLPIRIPFLKRRAVAGAMVVFSCMFAGPLPAQELPSETMLNTLRERLLNPSDAFPRAAEIPRVQLTLDGGKVVMDAEIHTAVEVAVPLPGRLPVWSPVSVRVDGKPAELICRREGYLWTVLPEGVHHVVVELMLPDVTEWEWTFVLKPRVVSIDAPGWTVSGVGPNGVPETQVFFARQREASPGAAEYDRKDFNAIVAVERNIETGLEWQIRSVVRRLSGVGKAISIKVPLLDGENVLTADRTIEDGFIEVRLGAGQQEFSWNSELPIGKEINLLAPETDQWVERWHLITSPVWNVSRTGLAPIFESSQRNLIPVWQPWPKEEVTLAFSEPEAVVGDTITVQRISHETELGSRQRTMQMAIDLECSLGGDFPLKIDPRSEISSVRVDGRPIPVRKDGDALIVPVRPGRQNVVVNWRTSEELKTIVNSGSVELPVEAANISSLVRVPESRWVLWAEGPTKGPAVRFWAILVFAIVAGLVLGSVKVSPLGRFEWVLLMIGLTQVHIAAGMFVVAWLFLLGWRGRSDPERLRFWIFDLQQIALVIITFIALGILIVVVGAGLLGNPEMFIIGNGSSQTYLNWFQPRADLRLPEPMIVSVSVWYYRLLMLFWALWLAFALLRWLATGWKHFTHGGGWRRRPVRAVAEAAVIDPSADETQASD